MPTLSSALEWFEDDTAVIGFHPDYIPDHHSLYDELTATVDWSQPRVRVFGKSHPVPRMLAFFGDAGIGYGYSGLRHEARPWPAPLAAIRERLRRDLGEDFNCVLVNWYRSGADSMGFHSDDERELGPRPCIASISLGAPRRFVLRPKKGVPGEKRVYDLPGGSLLVMAGPTQHCWQHALPRQRSAEQGRVNLTFRKVKSSENPQCKKCNKSSQNER